MLRKHNDTVLAMMEVLSMPAVIHKDEFVNGVQWRVRPVVEKLDANFPAPQWTEVPAAEMQASTQPETKDLDRMVREQARQIQRLEWMLEALTPKEKELTPCSCPTPEIHHLRAPTYKGKKFYVSKGRLYKRLNKVFGMSYRDVNKLQFDFPKRLVRANGNRYEYCMPEVTNWININMPEITGHYLKAPLFFGSDGQSLLKDVLPVNRKLTCKTHADGDRYYAWPKSMEIGEKLYIFRPDHIGTYANMRDKIHMWAWRKNYTVAISKTGPDIVIRRDK